MCKAQGEVALKFELGWPGHQEGLGTDKEGRAGRSGLFHPFRDFDFSPERRNPGKIRAEE